MQNYNRTDTFIHQLSQTLAKFGKAFVANQKDDSHTNIGFDFIGKKLWSHEAKFGHNSCFLTYNFANQCFEIVSSNYITIKSFATINKHFIEVEVQLAQFLQDNFQANTQTFLKPLHFEIPAYNFANQPIEKLSDDAIKLWLHNRHQANTACFGLLTHLNKAASIRIWPHHFDTGIYVEFTKTLGIGFGLAMADAMVNEAYYYFSVYGLLGNEVDYTTTKNLENGEWLLSENWNGAVLKLSHTTSGNIINYLQQTTNWALTQIKTL